MPRYGTLDREYGMRLATCDPATDGAIYMLNLMKYRDRAEYSGADASAADDSGISGREADDRYTPVDVLTAIGATVCFIADVLSASEDWDRVAVVRYPTRRAFIEMQSRKDFQEKHVHKEAGMHRTIVMATLPVHDLPARARPNRVLLEVWQGDARAPAGHEHAVVFDVEGTIIGDGRKWSGARYTTIDDDPEVDLSPAPTHQVLVLEPALSRWR
jgi:hypothetical protein